MSLTFRRRPKAEPTQVAPFHPISLGSACTTKFQLSRRLYLQDRPAGSLEEFRQTVLIPGTSAANYERHLFDWTITPFTAIVCCLVEGTTGVFDRENFTVSGGVPVNTRLSTSHPHDFQASDPAKGLTEEDLDAQHPAVKAKLEHLARKFFGLNRRPGRHLYVFEGFPYFGHVAQVMAWLGSGSPEHDYRLLLVGHDDEGEQPYHALNSRLCWTRIPRAIAKPPEHVWEGDDTLWDQALAGFPLAAPIGRTARFASASTN